MAQLTVRGIDEELAAALKARAARAGRSAEAEHRRILEETLRPLRSPDFFEAARARRLKLSAREITSTELLRGDRDRDNR